MRSSALNVKCAVGDDQGIVLREGRDQTVVRDHRLDHIHQRSCVGVAQLDHAGDILVALGQAGLLRLGQRGRLPHISRRDDLDNRLPPGRW